MVAISVNFSHTMRCDVTEQSKVKAIPVQALGVAVPVPTQNKVIFVMFSRHRDVGRGTPFIRPKIFPLYSVYPSPKTK